MLGASVALDSEKTLASISYKVLGTVKKLIVTYIYVHMGGNGLITGTAF